VDGLQEDEKGSNSLGTTKKGIGPTYSSKASRNGIRVSDLLGDFNLFEQKFKTLVEAYKRMFVNLNVDVEAELERYKGFAEKGHIRMSPRPIAALVGSVLVSDFHQTG